MLKIKFSLSVKDIEGTNTKLQRFHEGYTIHFITKTRDMVKQSYQYIQGKLLGKGKGNMCTYAKDVKDCDNQSLQHFVSNSPWRHQPVLDHIQRDVVDAIGDPNHGSIHVDECCFPKQGKQSVGVASQYCGRLGKTANCQVGVFLGYAKGSYRTLIDEKLYLPREWVKDKVRRKKCGVPWYIRFKKKTELAWDMIRHAQKKKIPFGWIGMDCLYGRDSWLRNKIDHHGMVYIADIPDNLGVWLQCPKTGVPLRKKGVRGRNPTREKVIDGSEPVKVRDLKDQLDEGDWCHVFIRDTERRELWADMACLRVFPSEKDGLPGDECWLVIRVDSESKQVKYQYSNAPRDTSIHRFAEMSGSRYWIERAFEDGKGIAGLADYQLRSWTGWHHHMTISILAMLYLMVLSIDLGKKVDFLTVQDVKEIFEVIMPKREVTSEELLALLYEKHKRRLSAQGSHHRRNK
ncbi:MAG: IS701 family transposase [Atribacterota bacterium]